MAVVRVAAIKQAIPLPYSCSLETEIRRQQFQPRSRSPCSSSIGCGNSVQFLSASSSSSSRPLRLNQSQRPSHGFYVLACVPSSSPKATSIASTKLFVSGLSFRTTKESLRNAFQNFGELVEVNLVMDRIANRPRGFAFLRYTTEEQSKKAIEEMHGKFLHGRVIFVEVAKSKSELRQDLKEKPNR